MTSFGFWEPIVIVCFINLILVSGLYVNALSGILQLCTAAIAGIGGYAAAVLAVNFGWPFVPSLAVAAVAGAGVGAVLALLTARMALFVLKLTTLAFGEAVVVLVYNIDYLGGANSFTGIPLRTDLVAAASGAMLAILVAWAVDRSTIGFAARAVRDDPIAAGSVGISVRRIRVMTFTVGAAIIGLGGALQAHYLLVVSPHELGFFTSLSFIIFLIIGGTQTLRGPLLATILLTAIPEALRFAGEYRLILYGFIVVMVVLMRPEGMVTRKRPGGGRPLTGVPAGLASSRR
ncbi:MAG: branched-chain amino acid ABC transporter permease [Burkholderiaceae bacterium]|nr:branched-chain amino acid ABC transporter permease [Burkholderiaceae bacterium]